MIRLSAYILLCYPSRYLNDGWFQKKICDWNKYKSIGNIRLNNIGRCDTVTTIKSLPVFILPL